MPNYPHDPKRIPRESARGTRVTSNPAHPLATPADLKAFPPTTDPQFEEQRVMEKNPFGVGVTFRGHEADEAGTGKG